jgi:hypothetical protein
LTRAVESRIPVAGRRSTVIADGGGLVSAELHPIEGAEQVARLALDIAGGRISHIWAVRNPEKLRPWPTD